MQLTEWRWGYDTAVAYEGLSLLLLGLGSRKIARQGITTGIYTWIFTTWYRVQQQLSCLYDTVGHVLIIQRSFTGGAKGFTYHMVCTEA